jgi:hypothetical protein
MVVIDLQKMQVVAKIKLLQNDCSLILLHTIGIDKFISNSMGGKCGKGRQGNAAQ